MSVLKNVVMDKELQLPVIENGLQVYLASEPIVQIKS